MDAGKVLIQREWSDEELIESGFKYYQRRKRVVLARELPTEEAPLKLYYEHDELIATAGYMICFAAGWRKKKSLYDYHHWPVAPDHFAEYYVELDDPSWKPNRGQRHLIALGCKPYINPVGVWAKQLKQPQLIQGAEHDKPFEVPKGAWLLLAGKGTARGAPYWATDKAFQSRFYVA
jgi:hypothetical protein